MTGLKRFRFLMILFSVSLIFACGYMVSVPQLRNADNNEIVNVGDSIFALSGDIYDYLHSWAGETWRHYAISGTQLNGGILGPSIPEQYDTAKADNPNIRVVYMDGGGNDILLPAIALDPYNCKTCNYWWCGDLSQQCKDLIDDLYVDAVNLLNEMGQDNVQQVVYQGYYHTKFGVFGDLSKLSDAVDYGNQRLSQACSNASVNCVFVDPRSSFKNSYIIVDGIHPTKEGSKVLASLIWNVIDI
ncbi:MAG: SGNH/GDSL hydrolase family protein [Desulfobacterales bacterium]|nr:SGNH/GDSL hydrolase family protein [Desulfobacterales bacterium]MCP4159899.1 SGNH/GDSL hydrolase family protein [Deltaproteobacteria bacterium]